MYSNRKKTLSFIASFLITCSMVTPVYAKDTSLVQGIGAESSTSNLSKLKKSQWPSESETDSSSQTAPQPEAETYESSSNVQAIKDAANATDRIIVKYKDSTLKVSALSSAINAQVEEVKELPALSSKVFKLTQNSKLLQVIDELKKDPNVLYAEPDFKLLTPEIVKEQASQKTQSKAALKPETFNTTKAVSPNDPLYPKQWYLHNTGQKVDVPTNEPYATPGIDIHAPEAWEITQGSSDVTIAVITAGTEITNPDLIDNIWTNPNEDPSTDNDDDNNGYPNDIHGWDFAHHDNTLFDGDDYVADFRSTFYSQFIAASMNNEYGTIGVAPKVKLMPLKVFSGQGGYLSDAIEAIYYAEANGAKIAFLSWLLPNYSQELYEAVSNSKMLFVVGAGVQNADYLPMYPKAYHTDNVLSVNSVDHTGQFPSYGTVGKVNVDVAAPGLSLTVKGAQVQAGYGAEIHKYAGLNNAEYKAIYNGIGFETLPIVDGLDPKQSQDMFNQAMKFLDDYEPSKNVKVLFVQDDKFDPWASAEEDPLVATYKDLLDKAGYPESQIDVFTPADITENGPDLSTMQSHDIVIWATGTKFGAVQELITETDRTNLTAYLNGGGRLMITGPDSIDYIQSTYFVHDMLHLRDLGDGTNSDIALGVPSTIYDNHRYQMNYFSVSTTNVASNDPSITKVNLASPSDFYTYEGEDAAAALAAGTAGLVMSEFPSMDAAAVRKRIMNSGTSLSSLLNMNASGKMINAFRALTSNDIPGTPLHDSTVTKKLDANVGESDDVYTLDLSAGESLTATLTGDAGTDFDLYLYDSTASTVKSKKGILAKSESDSSTESITYTVTATGTYYINVRAHQGAGSYTLHLNSSNQAGTFQDTDNSLIYNGQWSTANSTTGTFRQINAAGSVEFGFRGNQIEWIGTKNQNQGIADVYIDGNKVASPSLYSKAVLYEQTLFKQSLSNGHHTIKIVWTGQSDPSITNSAYSYINVDAFRATTLMRANDPSAVFNGPWGSAFSESYSRGEQRFTQTKDSSVVYTISGSAVTLLVNTGKDRGKADIYIDDQHIANVDLYSPTTTYQVPVFTTALSKGKHTLKVVNSGIKNDKSTGTLITIDSLHFVD
ncbi:S8 family serine peptidase [Paenibacillus sp. 5J-6]|uniref:S8 family serine peptidase n=1 Tax=Paenibacillus silvestris TaxID=2606219 RepID=A0A6L8V5F6_9BACL|nr:S8 family serine peptidase [Paenibacillus silvestris]MZQ84816.1 S8 family serine peptidase [Paenibacillus silvestris]